LQPRLAPISTALGEIFYYTVEFATNLSLTPGFSPVNATNEQPTAALAASRTHEAVETASSTPSSPITGLKPGANESANERLNRREQLMALKQIQEYVVSPLLRATPGVAEVNTSGGYERQIVIMPDPARLASVGLSLEELAHAISENTENVGVGLVEIGGEQVVIRANSRVSTTEEIAQLPLKFAGSAQPLLVQDVAQVGIGSGYR
jgi:Cu/Ag efflux pump CusA